jgi:hypothetical protein
VQKEVHEAEPGRIRHNLPPGEGPVLLELLLRFIEHEYSSAIFRNKRNVSCSR